MRILERKIKDLRDQQGEAENVADELSDRGLSDASTQEERYARSLRRSANRLQLIQKVVRVLTAGIIR